MNNLLVTVVVVVVVLVVLVVLAVVVVLLVVLQLLLLLLILLPVPLIVVVVVVVLTVATVVASLKLQRRISMRTIKRRGTVTQTVRTQRGQYFHWNLFACREQSRQKNVRETEERQAGPIEEVAGAE